MGNIGFTNNPEFEAHRIVLDFYREYGSYALHRADLRGRENKHSIYVPDATGDASGLERGCHRLLSSVACEIGTGDADDCLSSYGVSLDVSYYSRRPILKRNHRSAR